MNQDKNPEPFNWWKVIIFLTFLMVAAILAGDVWFYYTMYKESWG
jgi:hypothetical protein